MFSLDIYGWSCVFILSVTVFLGWLRPRSTRKLPLPPGPPGLPFLKNLFDFPAKLEHLGYQTLSKKYGDVMYMTALGRHIIVLNSEKAAVELLDQRSGMYSDRPYLPMVFDEDLMALGFTIAVKPYDRSWKLHRRLFTQSINPTTVSGLFAARQLTTVHQLLYNLLLNPKPADLNGTFSHTTASIILGIAYGYNVKSEKDPLAELATEFARMGIDGFSPKFLVNVFPILKHLHWFPGFTFKQFAQKARTMHEQLRQLAFDGAKQRIDAGDYTPSFVQTALAEHADGHDPESLQAIKDVALTMFTAGVDTTNSVLHTLVLQLILHPHIQTRAQAELDKVLGSPDSPIFRLPTFEDRSSCPYIEAVLKEGIRWGPSVSLGVPHTALEEDEYRGWRIPKGSIIIPSAYGMNRDEHVYPNPNKFDPERFIKNEGKPAQVDPVGTFGFGRRVCPGRYLAESIIWIEIASMLACFTIHPPKDEMTGQPMDLRWAEEHKPSGSLECQSYPSVFEPRSERVEKVIQEMALHAAP